MHFHHQLGNTHCSRSHKEMNVECPSLICEVKTWLNDKSRNCIIMFFTRKFCHFCCRRFQTNLCLWQRDTRSTRERRKCAIQGEDRDEEVGQEGGEMEGEEAGIEARTGDFDSCFSQSTHTKKVSNTNLHWIHTF